MGIENRTSMNIPTSPSLQTLQSNKKFFQEVLAGGGNREGQPSFLDLAGVEAKALTNRNNDGNFTFTRSSIQAFRASGAITADQRLASLKLIETRESLKEVESQIEERTGGLSLEESVESFNNELGGDRSGGEGAAGAGGGRGDIGLPGNFIRRSRIQGVRQEAADLDAAAKEQITSSSRQSREGCANTKTMGLEGQLRSTIFKRKFRWLFEIPKLVGGSFASTNTSSSSGGGGEVDAIGAFVAFKGARPNLSFKEVMAQHLNETIYYPGKPDWKPINVTLYDTTNGNQPHPIFEWIKTIYYPGPGGIGSWRPSSFSTGASSNSSSSSDLKGGGFFKIPEANLILLDGCGNTLEKWTFENVWPQAIDFGELDMGNSDVVTVDLTLRYDRAYLNFVNGIENADSSGGGGFSEAKGVTESDVLSPHNIARGNCGLDPSPGG